MNSRILIELVPIEIDPEVCLAAVLLDIPVIRVSGMGPVFDPNPALGIDKSLLPFLGAVLDSRLSDDRLALPVLIQLRDERDLAGGRESSLLDLPVDLVGPGPRHG
jgi:hypothetical protein